MCASRQRTFEAKLKQATIQRWTSLARKIEVFPAQWDRIEMFSDKTKKGIFS